MRFVDHTRLHYLLVFSLAILLYGNTLHHAFVLDDDAVIVRNTYVQQGAGGIKAIFSNDSFAGFERIGQGASILEGGRYRPLSLAFFALIYALAGPNPLPLHLFNILAYGITGLILYRTISTIFHKLGSGNALALLITALFLAHPVHTEVVANIKSADEILALLFGLSAMLCLLTAYDTGKRFPLWLSGVFMLLACLSKESAITFLITIPLVLWFFRKASLRWTGFYTIPLVLGAAVFLMLRESALGGLAAGTMMSDPLNNPFLQWDGQGWIPCSMLVKAATILYTFWKHVWLIIIPFPLTHDYYPFHIALQSFSSPGAIGGLTLFVAFLLIGIFSLLKKTIEGYGILFFLLTLVLTANVLFPVGTFMAERFLFLPSLGLILSIVLLGWRMAGADKSRLLFVAVGFVLVVFSVMTVMRNQAWRDNETLLRTDVRYSPNSAKLQNDLGTILLDKALKESDPSTRKSLLHEALPHLQKANELHPTYYDAMLAYGACAYYAEQYPLSVDAYRRASRLYPGDSKSSTGLVYALQAYGKDQWTKGDTTIAFKSLREAWTLQPDTAVARQLSKYYEAVGEMEISKGWIARVRQGIR